MGTDLSSVLSVLILINLLLMRVLLKLGKNMKIVGSGYLKLNFLMGLMIGLIVYLTKIFMIVNMLNLFLVKIVLGRDHGLVGSKEFCLSRILIGLWVNYYV